MTLGGVENLAVIGDDQQPGWSAAGTDGCLNPGIGGGGEAEAQGGMDCLAALGGRIEHRHRLRDGHGPRDGLHMLKESLPAF